jgi:nucleoside-diphosphate-sugar epimerase
MNETCGNSRLAQNELALKASTPFRDGIEKFVEWYKAYLSER